MKLILATTAIALCTTNAMAQGFTGGSVGLSFSGFTDEDNSNGDTTKFDANAEFAVTGDISVAADLTTRSFDGTDDSVNGFTLHGIYAISPDVSLGVFATRETVEDNDVDTYGGEIAYVSGPIEAQGFLGTSDLNGEDSTLFGVAGSYGLGNGFSITSAYNRLDDNDDDVAFSKIEIGAEYAVGNGAEIYASLGNTQFDFFGSSSDADFFRVGATFNFGPEGGTTFDRRGFFDAFGLFGL